jgi:hypothetical protein
MAVDLAQIIPPLVNGKVDFILIGGMAAILHGSARVTLDADIVYDRGAPNLKRLAEVLQALKPTLRGVPSGLPFKLDVTTLRNGLNFTLTTKLGDLDLFGEVTGGGSYNQLVPHSIDIEAFGVRFKVVDLVTLIRIKEAAGRAKDREAIAELRVLLEEQRRDRA